MKPTETRATFIIDKDLWKIIQLIGSKLSCYRDNNTVSPCTGSDIIREELDNWLTEQAPKWYPKLLEEFKTHNIHSRARDLIEQAIKELEEGEE